MARVCEPILISVPACVPVPVPEEPIGHGHGHAHGHEKNIRKEYMFISRDIISMSDFTKQEIVAILDYAEQLKVSAVPLLRGKILANCFFEPSTRTRLSFETAMKRLGGEVIGFADAKTTSVAKRESLYDSMKVIGQYADLIVIRHPLEGAARLAAEATDTPVINAGDGSNQHPTQTLLDLFSIRECQGKLDGLHIAFMGDFPHARTLHSLIQACSLFDVRMYFVISHGLDLPKPMYDELKSRSILFSIHASVEEIIPKIDILYVTRLQEERFLDKNEYLQKQPITLTPQKLENAKPTLRVLHPLPRVDELDPQLDATPYAYYFEQSQNGICLRQAIINLLVGVTG